jgi:GWxTD domain-containing protein
LAFFGSSVLLAAGAAAAAEGPPVDTRRFPRLARLFLLPDEESLLKELRDDADRKEFQRIFWARRDPTPGTTVNEFEDSVRSIWAQADELFSSPIEKGSETGCGIVLALLGRPEEILGRTGGAPVRFDNLSYVREGAAREPETWVYRDRPGRPFHFTRAELRVAFDSDCRFAEGGIVKEDLDRAAAVLVTRPELGYKRGSDGRLLPLAAAAPAAAGSAGARALFESPRTDFPLVAETKLSMRRPNGEAYVAGLLRVSAAATGGPAAFAVAAQARDASGAVVASAAREVTAPPSPDGAFLASWGLSLKPGRYKLALAALLEAGQGSVADHDVEVPDLGGAALATSPLVVYADAPRSSGANDPRDPMAALQLGSNRIDARIGNVFAPSEALMVVATIHGAKPDPATGRASLRARYSVLKDGKSVARGAEDAFATPDAVASVGPIPLATYAPGAYVVRLDVSDTVAGTTLRQEAAFEIRAAGGTP